MSLTSNVQPFCVVFSLFCVRIDRWLLIGSGLRSLFLLLRSNCEYIVQSIIVKKYKFEPECNKATLFPHGTIKPLVCLVVNCFSFNLLLPLIFHLPYIFTISDCSWQYFSSNGSVFSSPNYPDWYYGDMDCNYVVEAPPGMVIRFTFNDVDLDDLSCRTDNIEVRIKALDVTHFC